MLSFQEYLTERFGWTLKYHKRLNPKLWSKGSLKSGFRDKMLNLAYEFTSFSGVDKSRIKDIVMTGGNVNYNYTKFSDIDIHILCDLDNLDSNKIYDKKVEWTKTHNDEVQSYPLEFYVGNAKDKFPLGQGFYSLLDDKWVIEPQHLDHVESLGDPFVAKKIEHEIKYLKYLIKSGTKEQIETWKEKMHFRRQSGLEKGGEFSVENVLYKEIRNKGWLDKLNDKYQQLKS
jgi:predicted nucleotidyltransferase